MSHRGLPVDQLVVRALAGDRRALGRLLSVVEAGGADADRVTTLTHEHAGRAHVVGITGPWVKQSDLPRGGLAQNDV
jgi:putative protein kinase ArgK-like GTPase of G3E family